MQNRLPPQHILFRQFLVRHTLPGKFISKVFGNLRDLLLPALFYRTAGSFRVQIGEIASRFGQFPQKRRNLPVMGILLCIFLDLSD